MESSRIKWIKTTCYAYEGDLPVKVVETMEEFPEADRAVETAVEVKLDSNPAEIKSWTDQGYVVQGYYSGKVQLIKHREAS